MSDDKKISRRDWFRLRPSPTPSDDAANPTTNSMGEVLSGLQAIDHPVNHDGMDLSELPPMREAFLSKEQVCQLFSDIQSLASDILLMQRSARAQRATASRATAAEQLLTARDTLLSGSVSRVQIRYHWQDADWIDTLENRDESVRLIRITHNATNSTKRVGRSPKAAF